MNDQTSQRCEEKISEQICGKRLRNKRRTAHLQLHQNAPNAALFTCILNLSPKAQRWYHKVMTTHTHTHTHTHTQTHTHTHTHRQTHARTHAHKHTHIHARTTSNEENKMCRHIKICFLPQRASQPMLIDSTLKLTILHTRGACT
jgi:hypothetical protein